MKNLFFVLILALVLNPLAFAQTAEAVPPKKVSEAIRVLVNEKKAEISEDKAEMERLSKEVTSLKEALKGPKDKQVAGVALFVVGLFSSSYMSARFLNGVERQAKTKTKVFLAVSALGLLIGGFVSLGVLSNGKKIKKLEKAISEAEAAIKKYQAELEKDERSLEELELQLALHANE